MFGMRHSSRRKLKRSVNGPRSQSMSAFGPKRTRSFTLHLPHTGVLFFLGFIRPTFSRALALTIKLPTDAAGTVGYTVDSSQSRRRRGHNCRRRFHPEAHLASRMTEMSFSWLIEAHRFSA